MTKFDLPESIVGSYWNRFAIVSSNNKGVWQSEKNQGVVLDFTKLRQFLADEVKNNHGEVWMGCRYVSHVQNDQEIMITIKNNLLDRTEKVTAKLLVDATGSKRAIMGRKGEKKPEFVKATGVEYLIKVDDEVYKKNANTLTFLLGYKWIPKGYSWVFPMEKNFLKVGGGLIYRPHEIIKNVNSIEYYINLLIKDYLQLDSYEIIDKHGESLLYSPGLQDEYLDGRIIAIGDTVSTVNPLGGEGIRHAMVSAEIAYKHIDKFLKGEIKVLDGYKQEMYSVFLNIWKISEKMAQRKYLQQGDILVDKFVSSFKSMSLEEIVDILFYYKFKTLSKNVGLYFWQKLKSKILSIFS